MRIQKDNYSCGAVSIQNAMLALGLKPLGLKKLKRKTKTLSKKPGRKRYGTRFDFMLPVIHSLGMKTKRVKKRTQKNAVYIVRYAYPSGGGHFVAVSPKGIHNMWFRHRFCKTVKKNRKFSKSEIYKISLKKNYK